MSRESVQAFLDAHAPDIAIVESSGSTATVALAAADHGVAAGQIAKTLCVRLQDGIALIVMSGAARLDNRKHKAVFGTKVRMLSGDDVVAATGHPVGGVCPFGLPSPLPVYADLSLRAFEVVVPAAGSTNTALFIAVDRLVTLTHARWVDVSEPIEAAGREGGSPDGP